MNKTTRINWHLDSADRLEQNARRLQEAHIKSTLWVDSFVLWSHKARIERAQARELADEQGKDFAGMVRDHLRKRLNIKQP